MIVRNFFSNCHLEQYMKRFKFSSSGKYFAIAGNIELDTILVYDSLDIETLLSEKVSQGRYLSSLRAPEIKDT